MWPALGQYGQLYVARRSLAMRQPYCLTLPYMISALVSAEGRIFFPVASLERKEICTGGDFY